MDKPSEKQTDVERVTEGGRDGGKDNQRKKQKCRERQEANDGWTDIQTEKQ